MPRSNSILPTTRGFAGGNLSTREVPEDEEVPQVTTALIRAAFRLIMGSPVLAYVLHALVEPSPPACEVTTRLQSFLKRKSTAYRNTPLPLSPRSIPCVRRHTSLRTSEGGLND